MPISFYQARQQILDATPLTSIETVTLLEAQGRAVAIDIISNHSLPQFNNSAMDGYAVKVADCSIGTTIPVIGYQLAGKTTLDKIQPHSAIRIMTGAQIPVGADAVIPFENCREQTDQITIIQQVKSGDNIRWAGEDVHPSDLIIKAGTPLRPAEISILASLKHQNIEVYSKVKVAILATGDELQDIDSAPASGKIVNSNSLAIAAAVHELGGIPIILGIARDNRQELLVKIKEGLQADVLITTAGVSAGDRDLVRDVLAELKVDELFWKVKIKPGHPTAFGMYNKTPVFSLPGNPVATLLTFEEFVRPALLKMMGHYTILKPLFSATLTAPIKKKKGRLQILRVRIDLNQKGEMMVSSAGDQNTGMQMTSVNAQGIALLAAERDFFAVGEKIEVHLF